MNCLKDDTSSKIWFALNSLFVLYFWKPMLYVLGGFTFQIQGTWYAVKCELNSTALILIWSSLFWWSLIFWTLDFLHLQYSNQWISFTVKSISQILSFLLLIFYYLGSLRYWVSNACLFWSCSLIRKWWKCELKHQFKITVEFTRYISNCITHLTGLENNGSQLATD